MQLPTYNQRQKEIIDYLYKFRFIIIKQFLELYNVKDSKYTRELLDDLIAKKLVAQIKDAKNPTKPIIYCLAQRSRYILEREEDINENYLKWIYKEKSKDEIFIARQLFILDAYLFLLRNKEKGATVNFYTRQDLAVYDYFPNPLPDAYVDIEDNEGNTRYFLDYFDRFAPLDLIRYRIGYYFKYFKEDEWQDNTDGAPFPSVLIICSSEKRKAHLTYYTKALIEKSTDDEIEFSLTTRTDLKFAKQGVNIWQKVE